MESLNNQRSRGLFHPNPKIIDKIIIKNTKRGVKIMKKSLISCLAVMLATGFLTACTNKDMGTVGGAALGGVAGSAITGGSTAGTVVGAVGGGLIGRAVTN
jgi:osmotically inducible lipoprotein OsmB